MKTTTKIGVGVAGVAMLACAAIAPSAFAQGAMQEGMSEFRDSVKEVIASGDYDAWATLMTEHADERCEEAKAKITPETFTGLQQVQELIEAGDKEGARELAEELGLPGHHMGGKGMRGEGGPGMGMKGNGEMKQILEARDYDAWAAFMEEHKGPKNVEVNEETFNTMLEIHDLMEAGDFEGARELKESFRNR